MPDTNELSALVLAAQSTGVSYQQMADRAARHGHKVSKPYMQRLASGGVPSGPNPQQLAAIAAGIGKPLGLVKRAAAAQYFDYRPTEVTDEDTWTMINLLVAMEPAERRRWRAMIDAAVAVKE